MAAAALRFLLASATLWIPFCKGFDMFDAYKFLANRENENSTIIADYNAGMSVEKVSAKYNRTTRSIVATLSRAESYKPVAYSVRTKKACDYCKSVVEYGSKHSCANCGAPLI